MSQTTHVPDLRQLYRRWMLELWNGDLLRARDGRFAEHWVSSDGLQLMARLGALGPGA
jgi:hypothetical protein